MNKYLDISCLEQIFAGIKTMIQKEVSAAVKSAVADLAKDAIQEQAEKISGDLEKSLTDLVNQKLADYRLPECTLEEMRQRIKDEGTYPKEATIITYVTEDE